MVKRPSSSLLFGVSLPTSYVLFGVVAALHYPTAYGPFHNNTLSQLGNRYLNPHGFMYYLAGCAVAGVLAIGFFLSLGAWKRSGTRIQNRMLLAVQTLGVAGGVALVMNAVYPETQLHIHQFWSGVLFNSLGGAMLIAPVALWRRQHPNVRLLSLSLLVAAAVVIMFVFARDHWVEWVPVTLFLVSPTLLGLHGQRETVTVQKA